MPLLKRESVGAAILVLELCPARESVAIQFAAGSWPDRARGLNRFGMTRERLSPSRSEWLSFMTSSPERSFQQARRALFSNSGESHLTLTASRGEVSASGRAWGQARFDLPGNPLWLETPRLAESIPSRVPLLPLDSTATLPPFLCAAYSAFSKALPDSALPFLHNGKRYMLHSTVEREAASTMLLSASIRSDTGKTTSSFRGWREASSDLFMPTRFEFQPREFLKLTFVEDSSALAPALSSLLTGEAE